MPTVTTLSSTQKPITRTGASARKSTNSAPSAGPRTRTPPAIKWLLNERAALAGAQQSTQDAIPRLKQQVELAQERLARAEHELSRFKQAEIVWCQEEPRNMGAWFFVDTFIEWVLNQIQAKHRRPRYAGRPAAAATATGLMSKHLAQLKQFMDEALG